MNWKNVLSAAIPLLCLSNVAEAVIREDKLVCGLPDGSSFVLRSEYNWSPIPLPVYHHSRESEPTGWSFSFRSRQGKTNQLEGGADFHGKDKLALEHACAHVGAKAGVPLAPFTFQRTDGSWNSTALFPMHELDVDLSTANDETRRRMERAGIEWALIHFGLILPHGKQLIFEKPLHRARIGTVFIKPFDAVLQSVSEDGGKTWSAPIVTEDARIFEIGKGWIEQSFRARPVSLNGKPVQ
jgi:hypothetical protein